MEYIGGEYAEGFLYYCYNFPVNLKSVQSLLKTHKQVVYSHTTAAGTVKDLLCTKCVKRINTIPSIVTDIPVPYHFLITIWEECTGHKDLYYTFMDEVIRVQSDVMWLVAS